MGCDVIGDVHGHADRLEALLRKLGYRERGGAWRHPDRTAVFVGDFVDRGPGQVRTLVLARAMIETGSARAVMGNHELNAIAWATPDPSNEGLYLRPRHGRIGEKNRRQHEAFLAEVTPDSAEHRSWIDWFRELPLWIEEKEFRVIHACWSPKHVEALRPSLRPGNRLGDELMEAACRRGNGAYEAVETLLKGAEIELPPGYTFTDKDGHVRNAIRTKWWDADVRTFEEAYMGPGGVEMPDLPLPVMDRMPRPDRPTFVGHYWLDPRALPTPLTDVVACVDYSVAKGGPLVAYRFDGEPRLLSDKFVSV